MKELLNKIKEYMEMNDDTNTALYDEVLGALHIKKELPKKQQNLVNISQTFESDYHINEKNYVWNTIQEKQVNILEHLLINKDYIENNKRECTSIGKILLSYIKHFEAFPEYIEIQWIIEKRKNDKKLTAPSMFSKAFIHIKENNKQVPVLDEGFFYQLKNINFNNIKHFIQDKKETKKHDNMISDFSQYE